MEGHAKVVIRSSKTSERLPFFFLARSEVSNMLSAVRTAPQIEKLEELAKPTPSSTESIHLTNSISLHFCSTHPILEIKINAQDLEKIRAKASENLNMVASESFTAVDLIQHARNCGSYGFRGDSLDKAVKQKFLAACESLMKARSDLDPEKTFRITSLAVLALRDPRVIFASTPLSIRLSATEGDATIEAGPTQQLTFDRLKEKVTAAIHRGSRPSRCIRDWEGKIKRAEKALKLLDSAASLHHDGFSVTQIANQLGLTDMTLSAYMRGESPRAVAVIEEASKPRTATTLHLEAKRTPSESYAFVLGAYQAKSALGGSDQGIFIYSSEESKVRRIQDALREAAPDLRHNVSFAELPEGPRWRLGISSEIEARGLKTLTNNNTEIPFAVLGKQEEKAAFIRGFLTLRGTLSSSGIWIRNANNPELMIHLATLFESLGVIASVADAKRDCGLRISYQCGLARLRQVNALPNEMIVEMERLWPAETTPQLKLPSVTEQYLRCQALWRNSSNLGQSGIARIVNVHPGTVLEWVSKGTVPRQVQDLKALYEHKRIFRVAVPKVAATLFRIDGKSLEEAHAEAKSQRTLSRDWSEDFREAVETLQRE